MLAANQINYCGSLPLGNLFSLSYPENILAWPLPTLTTRTTWHSRSFTSRGDTKSQMHLVLLTHQPSIWLSYLLKEGWCSTQQKQVLEFCPSWFTILSCSPIKQQVGTYFHQIAISFFSHAVQYLIIIKIKYIVQVSGFLHLWNNYRPSKRFSLERYYYVCRPYVDHHNLIWSIAGV